MTHMKYYIKKIKTTYSILSLFNLIYIYIFVVVKQHKKKLKFYSLNHNYLNPTWFNAYKNIFVIKD